MEGGEEERGEVDIVGMKELGWKLKLVRFWLGIKNLDGNEDHNELN